MNDEVAVGIGYRLTSFQKKCQLAAQVNSGGVSIDGDAVDVLHGQVGLTVARVSRIEQAGNTWMVERRENLSFPQEPVDERRLKAPLPYHFDGDALLNLSVGAFRKIHGAHATAAEKAQQPVRSATGARLGIIQYGTLSGGSYFSGQGSVACARVEAEQCLNLRAHFVGDGPVRQIVFPLIRREVCKLMEKTLNVAFQLVSQARRRNEPAFCKSTGCFHKKSFTMMAGEERFAAEVG